MFRVMHLSMLSRLGGRPGIGGGFDSSHRPVVGTFDRFNGLSSNILLTCGCCFDIPQMPWVGTFEQKLSAQFKCPAYARPPPQQLNIDRCINAYQFNKNVLRNSVQDFHGRVKTWRPNSNNKTIGLQEI